MPHDLTLLDQISNVLAIMSAVILGAATLGVGIALVFGPIFYLIKRIFDK